MEMNLRAVKWAAVECKQQGSGELSVWRMMQAWQSAHRKWSMGLIAPRYGDVVKLGRLVEPEKNRQGTRTINVRVGFDLKEDWHTVDRSLQNLCSWEAYEATTPDEWYRMFEETHPFLDGNGRVGNILWNWLKGTLDPDRLAFPPDFWGERRTNAIFDKIE